MRFQTSLDLRPFLSFFLMAFCLSASAQSPPDPKALHGAPHDPQTDVTHDDPIVTGKIALAHMKEFPDYYERLERMEAEAERDWSTRGS